MKKKKISLMILLLGATIVLASCGSKKASSTQSSTKNTEKEVTTIRQEEKPQTVLTATLKENATVNSDEVSLSLENILAEEDSENILPLLSDGVILNVTKDQFKAEFLEADFQLGAEIEVVLDGLPMMTRSIPPQIAGMSILSIEGLK